MPPDIKITTGLLYQGALVFALMDAVYIPLLAWWVKEETFRRLKWPLVIAAALVWFGIWSWAIGNFWGTVYSYVFPAWAQTWAPWIAFVFAGPVALGLWALSLRSKANPIIIYCLFGGVLGSLTHIWAVYRGIVTSPPMLQGASPLGAVVIAFFEYIFYWCIILTIARIMDWTRRKLERSPQ
ncbi:MAG: hypothetical protein HGA79_10335 [Anaerolineales bacterium]|nr:hypothetical protein [Anaerolineales bacterium]